MTYKAKSVDTDKALQAISGARQYQEKASSLRIEKERSYLEGVNKGLDIGESIFECSNYEKDKEPSYVDGILDFMYELGKELDVSTQDLRDDFTLVDDAADAMAKRIREMYLNRDKN